jgi:hypothetical protein
MSIVIMDAFALVGILHVIPVIAVNLGALE